MYCEAPYGSTCDPLTGSPFPASKSYLPDTELSVFILAIDFAGNESATQQIDVLVEDNDPT